MGRVTGICFSLEDEWVLSVGRDKYFQWHETKKGKRMGGYQTQAWCTSIKYPFNHYIQYCEYIYVSKRIVINVVLKSLR